MPRVSSNRPAAAVRASESSSPKKLEFDLTKKATVRDLQIKSGDSFTVKLPPGNWEMSGLNGRDLFEFREKGTKKFLPLEQWSPQVKSGIELRASGAKGWNLLGQLTFKNEKGKELFLEMHVDGGKAPKNQRVEVDSGRRGVGGGGSDSGGGWLPRGGGRGVSGGGSGGWGG
ncbi:MAG: hypothetical protein AB1938_32080, partial [Myxococcota bacterium]